MHTSVTDASGRPLDVIALEGMRVQCVVGVYADERVRTQPLDVEVELFLDTRPAATGAGLAGTVDYARLAGELRFLLERCHFRMLEQAADALLHYVLAPPTRDAPRAQVQAATVRLRKPDALPGQAVPSVQLHRRADELHFAVEQKSFGAVDVLHESGTFGIYRLRIKPGGCIPTHVHRVMEEHELVLGAGLQLQKAPVRRGTAFKWPRDFAHRYDNPTDTEQTVLCVDSPPFIPTDEVQVSAELASLESVPSQSYYPAGDAS